MTNNKVAFNLIILESVLVLLSCCDIAYINHLNNFSSLLLCLRLILIAVFCLNIILKKITDLSKIFVLINILFLLFWVNSLLRTTSISYYMLQILSKPYLIGLYIQNNFNNNFKIKNILHVWKKVLLILCVIDFITIIIFPNGMYVEKNYSLNWFLGYKSARLVYSWPLLLITSYLDFCEIKDGQKYLSKSTFLSFSVCIFSAFRSHATGASTALMLYAGFIYLLKIKNDRTSGFKLYRIYNSKNVILCSGIIYSLVMSIDSNIYIQNMVTAIFNKSITLSNRTYIWKNCFRFFSQSPIWGKGIYTPLEYISISKYYLGTNAHNYLLTILISGGVIALIIYLYMFKVSMTRRTRIYTRQEISLIASVIVFLIVGATSSALAFSPFAFLPFILIEHEKIMKRKEDFNEKNVNEK